ncbi:MAG: IS110 family transposase [Gracilimonas sp.]|nr:IS110 family transposase [Gracilimonas sp.]
MHSVRYIQAGFSVARTPTVPTELFFLAFKRQYPRFMRQGGRVRIDPIIQILINHKMDFPMIYSFGADISKDEFSVCLLSYSLKQQKHHVLTRKAFANRPGGHKAFLSWLRRHTGQSSSIRVTMEATGVYYESLALYVHQQASGVHLSVVLPSKAKRYLQSRGLRSKTDKIDAYGLALMGAERKLSGWAGIDPFWRGLRQLTRTRGSLMDQRTQLRNQVHALAHSGQTGGEAEEALEQAITVMNQQMDRLTQRIYQQLRSRKDLAGQVERLRSIPGIGLLTIAIVLAETNGFEPFSSISQLISYSGYDVVIRESGKWAGKPKISKQGSKHIRRALYMPASVVVRSGTGPTYELYQRLINKHNIKMKGHVAVQKKLLTYMYILWNNGQWYDPQVICGQQASHQKKVALPEGKATVDTSHAKAS